MTFKDPQQPLRHISLKIAGTNIGSLRGSLAVGDLDLAIRRSQIIDIDITWQAMSRLRDTCLNLKNESGVLLSYVNLE